MSTELQFLLIPLVLLAFGGLTIYALVLRIRLWFYQQMIATVKDFIPNSKSSSRQPSGSGFGCLASLIFIALLCLLLLVLFLWIGGL